MTPFQLCLCSTHFLRSPYPSFCSEDDLLSFSYFRNTERPELAFESETTILPLHLPPSLCVFFQWKLLPWKNSPFSSDHIHMFPLIRTSFVAIVLSGKDILSWQDCLAQLLSCPLPSFSFLVTVLLCYQPGPHYLRSHLPWSPIPQISLFTSLVYVSFPLSQIPYSTNVAFFPYMFVNIE